VLALLLLLLLKLGVSKEFKLFLLFKLNNFIVFLLISILLSLILFILVFVAKLVFIFVLGSNKLNLLFLLIYKKLYK
jgi:hypothetical protein